MSDKTPEIYTKLRKVQMELKAPKSQRNDFGKYNYRSCEDILNAVKPLLDKHDLTLVVADELKNIGDRYYIKATAMVTDGENQIKACSYAREEETKKGMDAAQITGSASSYARKYALNGLFNIDDTKDADSHDNRKHVSKPAKKGVYATEPQVKLLLVKAREYSGLKERQEILDWFSEKVGNSPAEVKRDEVDDVIKFLEEERDV